MCFFSKKRKQKNELLDSECNALCEELGIAIEAANLYFANPNMYIDVSVADFWVSRYTYLPAKVDKKDIKKYKRCSRGNELLQKVSVFSGIYTSLKQNIINHNNNLAKRQIATA